MKKIITLLVFFLPLCYFAQTYNIGHHQENPGYPGITQTNPNILTEVYYPANTAGDDVPVANGRFPVVVFGHGFVMTWDSYSFLWQFLVPKGYICVFPRTHGSISPTHADFGKDLATLANYFPNVLNSASGSAFFNHVAPEVAIMGHSMGGGCSFLGASHNNQIKTFVTWAAANTTPSALDSGAYITTPTLVLAGTEDCVAPVADHQIPLFNSVASPLKHYVELTGASHCKFCDGNNFNCNFGEGTSCIGWGPFITTSEQQTRILALNEPWLRFYLKKDCTAWADYLAAVNSLDAAGNITAKTLQGDNIITAPQITQQGTTLTCNAIAGASYQWNVSNVPIPNATQSSYQVVLSGNYSVTVTYPSGCQQTSSIVNVTVSGVGNYQIFAPQIKIFPNPATDILHLSLTQLNTAELTIEVLDILGNRLWETKEKLSSQQLDKEIAINHLAKGVYLIKVSNQIGQTFVNWVKL